MLVIGLQLDKEITLSDTVSGNKIKIKMFLQPSLISGKGTLAIGIDAPQSVKIDFGKKARENEQG